MPIQIFQGGFVPHGADFNTYFIQQDHVIKPSDTGRTNVTTPTNDPDLVLQVQSGTIYWVQCQIIYVGDTTGDMPFKFTYPSGATFKWCSDALGSAATGTTDIISRTMQTTGTPAFGCVTGTDAIGPPKGILRVGSNSGSLRVLWGTGAALSATVRAGSTLSIRRLIQ